MGVSQPEGNLVVQVVEEPRAGSQDDRELVETKFVEQPPCQQRAQQRSTTVDGDVLAFLILEVRAFLDVAATDPLHAVWRMALATGMRRGELLGLQWSDVDKTTITIARQVLLRPDGRDLYVRETTKTRRARRARIDEETAAALRRWEKVGQAEEKLAFGPAWRTDGGHRLATEGAWIVTETNGYIVEPTR